MKTRMDIDSVEPRIYKAMAVSDNFMPTLNLEKKLQDLIRIRISQINGCGYCIDSHSQDAIKSGESIQRIIALSAWWETPFFTDQERSVLKFAEEITRISDHGISEETYADAIAHLGEQKLAQAVFVCITINSWNRIAISMHMVAGE